MSELDELRQKIAKAKGWIYQDKAPDGYNQSLIGWWKEPGDTMMGWRSFLYSPDWAHDIAEALKLAEEMCDRNSYEPDLLKIIGPFCDGWAVALVWDHHDGEIIEYQADGETLPIALCQLWLKWLDRKLERTA